MEKPIRLCSECISCLVRSKLEQYPEGTSNEKKIEYMQRVLKGISELKLHESGPIAARLIYNIQREMFGIHHDYTAIKKHFNELMLQKVPELEVALSCAEDELKLGIQYAMTGNYIDFAAMNTVDETVLQEFFVKAVDIPIPDMEYQTFQKEIERANQIVYLTDNCGEIVLDKLLIQILKKRNPNAVITAIVRGGEVVNDATMEDALQVGLTDVVEVIGNGCDIGGTFLEAISQEARETIDAADVIISKGQGNFETLQGCGKNIFYLFLCKCEMFAKRFGVPKFTGMLISEKECDTLHTCQSE